MYNLNLNKNAKWRSIIKQNIIEGKSGGFQWKFNMTKLAQNVLKSKLTLSTWPKVFNVVPKWRNFAKSSHIE